MLGRAFYKVEAVPPRTPPQPPQPELTPQEDLSMPHITFIHGISNKPAADKLLRLWRDSLAQDLLGNDDSLDLGSMGVSSSMIYWADILYDEPLEMPGLESTGG